MRASGSSGVLRVGYQWAADLGPWELVPDPATRKAYVLRARITSLNSYWLDREPLDLVLTVSNVEWLWRGVTLARGPDGRDVSIVLREMPIVSERVSAVHAR